LVSERKLKRLKSNRSKTGKEILESIEETRRDCMVRLLTEEFESRPEDTFEENIPTKWLRSHINPQQALTVTELVQLVKADYLEKSSEESQENTNGISITFLLFSRDSVNVMSPHKRNGFW
jgi:hypothetical protein